MVHNSEENQFSSWFVRLGFSTKLLIVPFFPLLDSLSLYCTSFLSSSRPFTCVRGKSLPHQKQAFQNFIDARIQPETDDLDVVFFDACIAAKRNRSMLHVTKKSDANFLR